MSDPVLPPLPRIEGDMDLMLDVYTHPSLHQAGAPMQNDYGDIHRLADLGAKVFDMAVTYHLFSKKPHMTLSDIKQRREELLSAAQADDWVTAYGLKGKLRIAIDQMDRLHVAEEMRTYFHTYIGAFYIRNGLGPVLQTWVSKLIDPSYAADVLLPESKASPVLQPPAYSSSNASSPFSQQIYSPPPPAGPAPPLPASPPPMSMGSPSPAGQVLPGMMNLVTLALVNQTAAKKGVAISYSAVPQGPPHQPTWTVRCLINEQERGIGVGKSQKMAKEEAARQAWMSMGW